MGALARAARLARRIKARPLLGDIRACGFNTMRKGMKKGDRASRGTAD